MKTRFLLAVAMLAGVALTARTGGAQTSAAVQAGPELLNFHDLTEQALPLLEQARAGDGSAKITLAQYPGHTTLLVARTASSTVELHQHWAEFLFVLAGEGTELTGGTLVDRKEGADGEVSGTRLEGAARRVLRKGDVIHIPAGTPHQAIEGPGQSMTLFVVKVAEPAS